MNQRIIFTYITLIAFFGLLAFTYITRSTNDRVHLQAEESDFEDRVKQVIRKNPALIVTSVMEWQQAQAEAEKEKLQRGAKTVAQAILNDDSLPRIGEGDIKVIEFYDYMCGYCKNMAPIKQKYSKQGVEFITIANPVLGKESAYLAHVTEAMRELSPENFASIHFEILTSNRSTNLNTLIDSLLSKYNINSAEFSTLMESDQIAEQVKHGAKYAETAGVYATPAYIINGQLHMGALSEGKFKQLIGQKK